MSIGRRAGARRRACRAQSRDRLLPIGEPAHLADHLCDRADVREVVQRHGNFEVILELAHQLEHLQRVEAEVGQKLARWRRLDRAPADAFENLDGVLLESIGGTGRFGSLGQAPKCSMNAGTRATAEPTRSVERFG